jgi:hypothetical protein
LTGSKAEAAGRQRRLTEVIDYMKQLVEVSPPDIANMDCKKRIACFMSGQADGC